MERLVLILVGIMFLVGILKVLGYYLLLKVTTPKQYKNSKPKETNKRKLTEEDDRRIASQNNLSNEYYILAKSLLKDLLQNKAISRQQLLHLKYIINGVVPETEVKYKNDMHEIYSKLKSPFLSNDDYRRIVKYLNIIVDLNY